MKVQNNNQKLINSIAWDNVQYIIENVNAGLTVEEAVNEHVDSAMNDPFDDETYDTPYDRQQLYDAFLFMVNASISESPTELRNYGTSHPEAYIGELPEPNDKVRIIKYNGKVYLVIYGESDLDDDIFFDF